MCSICRWTSCIHSYCYSINSLVLVMILYCSPYLLAHMFASCCMRLTLIIIGFGPKRDRCEFRFATFLYFVAIVCLLILSLIILFIFKSNNYGLVVSKCSSGHASILFTVCDYNQGGNIKAIRQLS